MAGRSRTVRSALRKAVEEARSAGRVVSVEHELQVLLADRYAAAVDKAARADDLATLVRVGARLEAVVDRLPLGVPASASSGGGAAGGGDGGRGSFLELVDGDPEVGDAADG